MAEEINIPGKVSILIGKIIVDLKKIFKKDFEFEL